MTKKTSKKQQTKAVTVRDLTHYYFTLKYKRPPRNMDIVCGTTYAENSLEALRSCVKYLDWRCRSASVYVLDDDRHMIRGDTEYGDGYCGTITLSHKLSLRVRFKRFLRRLGFLIRKFR